MCSQSTLEQRVYGRYHCDTLPTRRVIVIRNLIRICDGCEIIVRVLSTPNIVGRRIYKNCYGFFEIRDHDFGCISNRAHDTVGELISDTVIKAATLDDSTFFIDKSPDCFVTRENV